MFQCIRPKGYLPNFSSTSNGFRPSCFNKDKQTERKDRKNETDTKINKNKTTKTDANRKKKMDQTNAKKKKKE